MISSIQDPILLYELKDHTYAVAVCAFPNEFYITGSQDKKLRLWTKGTNTKNIDNAHGDIIRDIQPNHDYSMFYTCSNDQTIKSWNLFGQNLLTLEGHEGFIFKILIYNDYIFSSGDDKTVKVWDLEGRALLYTFEGVSSISCTDPGGLSLAAKI